MQHDIKVRGWPVTVTQGQKDWATPDHAPNSKGTLWIRRDVVTVHRPDGDKELEGYIQVKELRLNGKLVTVTGVFYKSETFDGANQSIVSLSAWLLEKNGIGPKPTPTPAPTKSS